ncbi:Serine/threonine-protein kinase ULK4 [Larimichthys crocea]|uniref:Uncharacterized protein n=1 Tax=Larimichthys crocea TaxID=215358 RepID=A0ACD3QWT6_LARCR|nr:Serine/threonine-protein kinase ULK4 [Larimichthys crocea]
MSELRPKSGVDEDNTEAIFLLSSCSNSRRSYSISDSPNQTPAPQASTDITSCVKDLIYTDSDLIVTPIMDNPKIVKSPPVRFDPKTLCVAAYSVEKLQSLSDEEWTVFLLQLCSSLGEQNSSVPLSSSSTAPSPPSIRSRLNLLCYLCCVVGHKVIGNRLINSPLLPVLTQQLRQAPNWDVGAFQHPLPESSCVTSFKHTPESLLVTQPFMLLVSLTQEGSEREERRAEMWGKRKKTKLTAVSTLTDLLRENLRNNKIKQLLLPPLGEFLYLIASQVNLA